MTIRNYLESLGIDGSAILSEETKTERYICKAFQLKRNSHSKSGYASIQIHEYPSRSLPLST